VAVSSTAAAARAFVDCDIGGRPLDRMSEAAGVGQRGDHVGVSSIAGSFRTQCANASAAVGARCAVGAVNAEGVRQPLIREHPPHRVNSDEKRGQMRVCSSPSLVPVEQWAPTRSRES